MAAAQVSRDAAEQITAANAQHIFLLGRQNVLFLWVNRYDMS